MTWDDMLARMPLIPILRGITPMDAVAVAEALFAAGLLCAEIPLNSPEALGSVSALRRALDGRMLIGAGTVMTEAHVAAVAEAGGQFIVSPNCDQRVITATKRAAMNSLPGFFTPGEAFAALAAGADGLKLFPAEAANPGALKAMTAVLPKTTAILPVGGVTVASMAVWRAAGASGFGIGGSIYKPGDSAGTVGARAASFVAEWRALSRTSFSAEKPEHL